MMIVVFVIGVLMMVSLALLNVREYENIKIKNISGEEIVLLNDLSNYCSMCWDDKDFTECMTKFVQRENKHDFCVMNNKEVVRFCYGDLHVSNLNEAYKNHCMIGDVVVDDVLVGKVVLADEVYQNSSKYKQTFYCILYVFLLVALVAELSYIFYIKKNIIAPFHRFKGVASEIAQGNLDVPFEKEKSNYFGSFTESFDIMREEIFLAKKREESERKRKEELAVSLNHDIKAPISAIKAIAELLSLKISKDKVTKEELLKKIGEINDKSMQTNMLVNNMLNVAIDSEYDSAPRMDSYYIDEVISVLKRADYQDKICLIQMENCMVRTDIAKLTQVFDNCITNSYKYADTPIKVYGSVEKNGKFCISIKDEGHSLKEDEVENLCIKYYRGSNSVEKDGSGLGLHVCKMIMESLNGELRCQQEPDGFCVKLYLSM